MIELFYDERKNESAVKATRGLSVHKRKVADQEDAVRGATKHQRGRDRWPREESEEEANVECNKDESWTSDRLAGQPGDDNGENWTHETSAKDNGSELYTNDGAREIGRKIPVNVQDAKCTWSDGGERVLHEGGTVNASGSSDGELSRHPSLLSTFAFARALLFTIQLQTSHELTFAHSPPFGLWAQTKGRRAYLSIMLSASM